MSQYEVEVISTFDQLANIKNEWNYLALQNQKLFPFLGYEWFKNWYFSFINSV